MKGERGIEETIKRVFFFFNIKPSFFPLSCLALECELFSLAHKLFYKFKKKEEE